jgi:hypothetical protein
MATRCFSRPGTASIEFQEMRTGGGLAADLFQHLKMKIGVLVRGAPRPRCVRADPPRDRLEAGQEQQGLFVQFIQPGGDFGVSLLLAASSGCRTETRNGYARSAARPGAIGSGSDQPDDPKGEVARADGRGLRVDKDRFEADPELADLVLGGWPWCCRAGR